MNVVQAFFTALLSGLFSGVTLFFLNDRRDRTSRRLSKLEEASEAYFRLGEAAADYIMSAYAVAKRELTDTEWNSANQSVHNEAISSLVRLETTLLIYAPELLDVVEYVREPWVSGLQVVTDVRMASLRPDAIEPALYQQLSPHSMNIVTGRKRGMIEIAAYCQQLANQPIRKARIKSR